jgi:hypothetical protein
MQENKMGMNHHVDGETQKRIDNHKVIAEHLKASSENHLAAANYHSVGDHERAKQVTIKAYEHLKIANDTQKEDEAYHKS